MSVRIRCPQCAASLKLRSREVLQRRPKCPACSFRLSEDSVELYAEDRIVVDTEAYSDDSRRPASAIKSRPTDGFATDDRVGHRNPSAADQRKPEHAGNGEGTAGTIGRKSGAVRVGRQPPVASVADLFYRVNGTRVTFKEYWWSNRNPLVLIGWLIKLLRIRIPSSTDDPPVKELAPFRTEYETFSPDARSDIGAVATELRNAGFHTPVFHLIRDDLQSTRYHYLSLVDQSGRTVAHVMRRFWNAAQPPRKRLFTTFITEFSDGRFLTTTNASADMLWPEKIELQRFVKDTPALLWQKHHDRLQQMSGSMQPMVVRSVDDLSQRLESYHQTLSEFHVHRGVFSELTAEDQKKLISAVETSESQSPDDQSPTTDEHRDVMIEIAARQNRQTGWVGNLLLLLVSLAVFIGLGAVNWSSGILLMLVPILFVHELGHYVAMKAFGYRNLKMFFIPMFGAAVTGQSYNVAGWKKVVVSLAGPVPGIILGAALGMIGLFTRRHWMIDFGVMSLIINGVNLVPVLPLDGGWVVHTLFFSRHYGFDVAFRVLAALALSGASIMSGDRFLVGLVAAMVVGIPTVLKSGRIVHRLRGNPEVQAVNSQSIPPRGAHVILDEIQKEFSASSLNTKGRANVTLSIFESLNSPAPGAGGTLMLAGAHFSSIAAAIIFLVVLILGKHSSFLDLINVAGGAPETPYICGSGEVSLAAGVDSPPAAKEICVVGNFAKPESAHAAFSELKGQVPSGAVLRILGNTLLLALPAGDDQVTAEWIGEFEAHGAKTAVRSDDFGVSFSILGVAPSEEVAKNTEREIQQLFSSNIGGAMLVPPWLPGTPVTESQQKARRTIILLQGGEPDDDDENPAAGVIPNEAEAPGEKAPDPTAERVQLISTQISEATRKGQKSVAEKLQKELRELMQQQEANRLTRIKQAGPDRIDIELVDLYSKRPVYPVSEQEEPEALKRKNEEFTRQTSEWQKHIHARLGLLATSGTDPVNPAEVRHAVHSGYVSRAGLILRLDYLTFSREVDGLPPLMDWLCTRGFVDLKYSVSFDDASSEDFDSDP